MDCSRFSGDDRGVSERIENLRKAVECTARHARSELVVESFQGQIVWEGMVEVLGLAGHPKRNAPCTWTYPDGEETRFATALETPPVESVQRAVRAAIGSGEQK
jgi:hypothetical protein